MFLFVDANCILWLAFTTMGLSDSFLSFFIFCKNVRNTSPVFSFYTTVNKSIRISSPPLHYFIWDSIREEFSFVKFFKLRFPFRDENIIIKYAASSKLNTCTHKVKCLHINTFVYPFYFFKKKLCMIFPAREINSIACI